jgi:hypothetical protein
MLVSTDERRVHDHDDAWPLEFFAPIIGTTLSNNFELLVVTHGYSYHRELPAQSKVKRALQRVSRPNQLGLCHHFFGIFSFFSLPPTIA